MRIGMGLPAAVPGTDPAEVGRWAAESEDRGFRSVSVIDRLVYDNLDPLVALAAAAARTRRIELLTTVLNVGYRRNPVVLAKQIASVDQLSGGRLTVGLGLGGWPEDYAASDVALSDRRGLMDATLGQMRAAWRGELTGAGGPMPALPDGRPGVLLGGLVPAAQARAATHTDGWVAPLFGLDVLREGAASVRREWARSGRPGTPRVVTGRYFCLGDGAEEIAKEYVAHYYGAESLSYVMPDVLTDPARLHEEIGRVSAAGADDLVLFPCSGEPAQVGLLSAALQQLRKAA